MSTLEPYKLAARQMKFNNKNVTIGLNVKLGARVRIGDNTTIYDNVVIGDDTIICNDCVIGEPTADYYRNPEYVNPTLTIGSGTLIRSHSILYAGSTIGEYFATGHRVTIREKSVFGHHCMVGSYSDIQGDCTIGNYTRMHSYVNIGQKSKIGSYVFFYPFVVLTNDPTPPSNQLVGVEIGDYAQITTSSVVLPGAVVKEHSLVGAHSTVGGKFEAYSFINGSPAKTVCDIRKAPFFNIETKRRHYPWPENFERGMPWENIGYTEWLNQQ